MNILYAGNLVNVGYHHVRQLRQMGVNIELLMEKEPPDNSNPLLRDPSLQAYPDWVIFYDKKKSGWKNEIIRIMRNSKYDLIHAHAELPIFAYLSRRPFIAHVMGSDLIEMAFSKSLRGILLRRSYKKAKIVVYSTPEQPPLLLKLGIKKTIYMPLISDFSFFNPIKVTNDKFKDKFIIFHPANHIWGVKGNDILIKGFSQFVRHNPNAVLLCIESGIDLDKSKKLIKSLGIEEKVIFSKRMNGEELLYHYNIADVVVDQFIFDGLGGIGVETLCCKKPLIVKCNKNAYKNLLPESPPILDASTPSEITERLLELENDEVRHEIGENGRTWIEKYFSPESIASKSLIIYESVLNNDTIETIREKISKF